MSLNPLRMSAVLAILTLIAAASPREITAQGPLRRLFARDQCANSYGADCRYCDGQVCDTSPIHMDFTVCVGDNNNCGILSTGFIDHGANDPAVRWVYMLVNQGCPTGGCATGSVNCANPGGSMVPARTVTWNAGMNRYDVNFGTVDDSGDRRIVRCSEDHTVCIVVCYHDNTCVSKEYPICPSALPGSGVGGTMTVECVYCNPDP